MFRLANISIAVTTVLLIAYTIAFHNNEDAMSAGGVLGIFFCLGLFFFLDRRDYARHSGDNDPS